MTTNLTDLRNQLALEILDDETLEELIQFRRETTKYHISQGNKVQAIMHNAVLSALIELQERRKAAAEPVCFIGERMLEDLTDGARSCGRVWLVGRDELSGENRTPLYTEPPAPAVSELETVVSELPTDDERIMEIEGIAPPVKVVPETLPCPVLLDPGLRFGKGVKTQLLFDALKRRAEYYAELDAMTPEQRAEHDAGIAEFKAMLNADGALTNEDTKIPATKFKPVADLYGITSPTGSETSFTFDAIEAADFIKGGWSVQEYVELERYQSAFTDTSNQ